MNLFKLGDVTDINDFVDTVLQVVYRHANTSKSSEVPLSVDKTQRNIIFTSFNPSICRVVNWKQPNCRSTTYHDDHGPVMTFPLSCRCGVLQHLLRIQKRLVQSTAEAQGRRADDPVRVGVLRRGVRGGCPATLHKGGGQVQPSQQFAGNHV
ncbi:hypothetical protein K493DRAFT_84108 [Basidiobolus meristosporus CBS 931.73]|uniref:Uncharacterized protein n=1 Tax=Basidiobolus meristosporus CBS 931.73 TaxID=1314790 RepID=A0A1Y1YXP3_9FUNG|nr:hypothetical protein K493DRAFT_84108 [Basidiobolus meristosporus CBS 931.73]|eukprot:ORY02335.1 hypothetical protein K493DRAFT_84108 [Basidiobolus meristosporus CBS 931.73]